MTTKRKVKKIVECVICGYAFEAKNAADMANTCMWVHIIKRDKHLKKILATLPKAPRKIK